MDLLPGERGESRFQGTAQPAPLKEDDDKDNGKDDDAKHAEQPTKRVIHPNFPGAVSAFS
jgi:hypothetical protein